MNKYEHFLSYTASFTVCLLAFFATNFFIREYSFWGLGRLYDVVIISIIVTVWRLCFAIFDGNKGVVRKRFIVFLVTAIACFAIIVCADKVSVHRMKKMVAKSEKRYASARKASKKAMSDIYILSDNDYGEILDEGWNENIGVYLNSELNTTWNIGKDFPWNAPDETAENVLFRVDNVSPSIHVGIEKNTDKYFHSLFKPSDDVWQAYDAMDATDHSRFIRSLLNDTGRHYLSHRLVKTDVDGTHLLVDIYHSMDDEDIYYSDAYAYMKKNGRIIVFTISADDLKSTDYFSVFDDYATRMYGRLHFKNDSN